MFKLPIHAMVIPTGPDVKLRVETRGLLSTGGGASTIVALLGKENVNVGCWGEPVTFICNNYDELEALRQLLEERLQVQGFDRDKSALVITAFYEREIDDPLYADG